MEPRGQEKRNIQALFSLTHLRVRRRSEVTPGVKWQMSARGAFEKDELVTQRAGEDA